MHLYLTNRSYLNSAYVNDSGQVMYKVETPNKFFNRVATIKRVLPGDFKSPSSEATSSDNHRSSDEATVCNDPVKSDVSDDDVSDEDADEEDDIQEAVGGNEIQFGDFGHLAEITFHPVTGSVLRFGGQEYESTQFFTKKAFGLHGRTRAFTGPDGIEYQWIPSGREVSELVRVNSERETTPIARFQRRRLGVFTKPRPASLEIFSEGMHMVDLIIITFIYIQKQRKNKDDQ